MLKAEEANGIRHEKTSITGHDFQRYQDETPRLPNYHRIIDTAKRLQRQLPYFKNVGWAFAVDCESEPVYIGFNVRQEQEQIGGRQPPSVELGDEALTKNT